MKNKVFYALLAVIIWVAGTDYSKAVSLFPNGAVDGVYKTTYGNMTLSANGNSVTGIYESGNGKLQGTLIGNKLSGTWHNSASKKSGKFEFVFTSDFSSFAGKYGYNSSTPSNKWNGTKISGPTSSDGTVETKTEVTTKQPISSPVQSYPSSNEINGTYSTTYGNMTLSVKGDAVTGIYESGNGKLQGTLNGNKLSGTWHNSASKKSGKFEFVFTSYFSSFTGKYGYNSSTPSNKWNGTKISGPTSSGGTVETKTEVTTKQPISSPVQSYPSSNEINGTYSTTYGNMTLSVKGDAVTGIYESGNGKFQGTLNGNKLSGTWHNSASKKSGKFEFVFTSDFSSFTGKYGYNEGIPYKKWNGTKLIR